MVDFIVDTKPKEVPSEPVEHVQTEFDMACDTFFETVEENNLDPEDAIVFNKEDSETVIIPALLAFQNYWDDYAGQDFKCPKCGKEFNESSQQKDVHSYEQVCENCKTRYAVHHVKRTIYKIIPPKEPNGETSTHNE